MLEDLLRRELFQQVPFSLAVIDPEYRIVEANRNFEEYFGQWTNRRCFEVCKGRKEQCRRCSAEATFRDGRARVSDENGVDRNGRTCHYVLHLAPLTDRDGRVRYILEMIRDVTETRQWQREYDILFDRVPCYITVIDRDFKIIRSNEKFRATFGENNGNFCYKAYKRRDTPCEECPAALTFSDGQEHTSEQIGVTREGSEADYVVNTTPLSRGPGGPEHIIEIATDVTRIKQLEHQKVEAERLAAVGQTVAGLAHTVKNLLMGLEGGMYMVDTGIRRGDPERLTQGWDVLQRNFNKTTEMVRGFLSFAKGKLPELKPTDPVEIVRAIVDLYHETAKRQGVDLRMEAPEQIAPAPLDPDGIEACLTNLASNGIDAAILREEGGGQVTIGVHEEDRVLIFEVRDNGIGIDPEIKQKIFTTFFTTKGGKGTGLGLLTTRKIVQEHGGKIELDSRKGEGSVFRILLPRDNLEALAKQTIPAT